MNIEIANRLQKLRKENGYSQEELADKLGISRQAVSKWERAESSPDTDNLIILARLYNMSLDELLYDTETNEEIKERTIDKEQAKEEGIKVDKSAISLTDDEGQTVKIEDGHIKFINPDGTEEKALHPVGLLATLAQTTMACSPAAAGAAEKIVRRFWDTPLRMGERRYYDNCLYMFAMLALSGKYKVE